MICSKTAKCFRGETKGLLRERDTRLLGEVPSLALSTLLSGIGLLGLTGSMENGVTLCPELAGTFTPTVGRDRDDGGGRESVERQISVPRLEGRDGEQNVVGRPFLWSGYV